MMFFENKKKFTKNNWIFIAVIIFYLLTSAAPLLWFRKISSQYQFIGRGDYLSPLNIKSVMYKDFYTINPDKSGVENAANFGHQIPTNIIFFILYSLHINPIKSTLLLISFIIFVSQISFYFSMTYFLAKKYKPITVETKFALALSGILYGYSPFVLSLIAPGHIILLFNYAVFPLIIVFTDKFINDNRGNFNHVKVLFFLFLFSSASFSNFAIIYLNLFILGIYSFLKMTIEKKLLINIVYKFLFLIIIVFLSNSWWLIAYIYELISNNVFPSVISPEIIKAYISYVPTPSYINLLLFGKTTFNYVVEEKERIFNILNIISMLFIWISFFKFIICKTFKTQKTHLIFLILMMVILYLTKGHSYPFPEIFNLLFYRIPGFVSFRNSHNKFIWFFWYCLLFLSTSGFIEILTNSTKKIVNFLLLFLFSCIALFYIIVFIKHPQLGLFNVPNYYKEVNNRLMEKKGTTSILLLPALEGGYAPFFGSDSNYYHGINYIPYVINYPFITVSSEIFQPKNYADMINKNIIQKKPICEYLKKLNISDILIMLDLNKNIVSIKNVNQLIANLKKQTEFYRYRLYKSKGQNGVYLFEVNKNCSGNYVNLKSEKNSSVAYKIVNPTMIQVDIKNLNKSSQLQLLANYNSNWVILAQKSKDFKINFFDLLLTKHILDTKELKPLYNYANSWQIDKDVFIKSFDSEYYKLNTDGSIDVKLVIYYKNQSYQYLGIIFFSVFIIFSSIFFIVFRI